jgi:hypothetical protein
MEIFGRFHYVIRACVMQYSFTNWKADEGAWKLLEKRGKRTGPRLKSR